MLLYLARALLEQGRRTETVALLARALELNPENRSVKDLIRESE